MSNVYLRAIAYVPYPVLAAMNTTRHVPLNRTASVSGRSGRVPAIQGVQRRATDCPIPHGVRAPTKARRGPCGLDIVLVLAQFRPDVFPEVRIYEE